MSSESGRQVRNAPQRGKKEKRTRAWTLVPQLKQFAKVVLFRKRNVAATQRPQDGVWFRTRDFYTGRTVNGGRGGEGTWTNVQGLGRSTWPA